MPPAELSFVDLLYAVPVAALATRLGNADLSLMKTSSWFDVALTLTAIALGWVGHHGNRLNLPSSVHMDERESQFLTLRFPQFVIEIFVIVAYFALATLVLIPEQGHPAASDDTRKAIWIIIAFGLYLVWDLLDVWIACFCAERHDTDGAEICWLERAARGMWVTLIFLCLSFIPLAIAASTSTVLLDIVLILGLLIYRAAQEFACKSLRLPRCQRHTIGV